MTAKRPRQRLAIFLDGTWNRMDDCTNVRHLHNLTREGRGRDGVVQLRYYDEGVGTGVLDGLSGGGFGLGLEGKVRSAYNWLVEHYQQGGGDYADDEIYVFGFSRGAYTARSLVGFIAACGILKRGAPLTVTQLWDGYGILGREKEHRENWWETLAGRRKSGFAAIRKLKWDPWRGGKLIRKSDGMNSTERLLVAWSRRARITYLGVFDTVGAMGFDALAIPGLRSRLALHHNMRPTVLIRRCRHALAIDEHRSSFRHTPLQQYLENQWDVARERKETARWSAIEQRWFVGSHSNIGGGYPDNALAARPLQWMLEGAADAGLRIRPLTGAIVPTAAERRDSYRDFVAPVWTDFVRAKRVFRRLAPPVDIRASRSKSSRPGSSRRGYSLRTIHESVDESVLELAKGDPDYAPPNLVEYARRQRPGDVDPAQWEVMSDLASREPQSDWLGDTNGGRAVLVLWCSGAALGMGVLHQVAFGAFPVFSEYGWRFMATAAVLVIVDWAETRGASWIALDPDAPVRRALKDAAFWLRFFSAPAFAIGAAMFVTTFARIGWDAPSLSALGSSVESVLRTWWPLPATAFAIALAVDLARRRPAPARNLGGAAAAIGVLVTGGLVAFAAFWMGTIRSSPPSASPDVVVAVADRAVRVAGGLLLLQLGLAALMRALHWVGVPLRRANLGSVVALQVALTPTRVNALFDRWTDSLDREWTDDADERRDSAVRRVGQLLRESLWRDLIGFIPLYSCVLGYGLWYAKTYLGGATFTWLDRDIAGAPVWLLLIAFTALFDVLENGLHLRHASHLGGTGPGRLAVGLGAVATGLKTLGFVAAVALNLWALMFGTVVVVAGPGGGWRRFLAGSASMLVVAFLVLTVVAWGKKRWSSSRRPREPARP